MMCWCSIFLIRLDGTVWDTFEIRNAHYKVYGYKGTLGCVDSQDKLLQILSIGEERNWGIVMKGFPRDSLVNWTIKEFGPLYIPAKGGTNMDDSS